MLSSPDLPVSRAQTAAFLARMWRKQGGTTTETGASVDAPLPEDLPPPTPSIPPEQAPDTPSAPTLTPGDRHIDVAWQTPGDGGSAITGYKVRYCMNSTGCDAASEWSAKTLSSASTTSTTISGLTNGTAYQVQVQATNSVGDSGWSASATGKPSTVPGAPALPMLTAKHKSLGVSWFAPTQDGGSTVTGYKVQYQACTATDGDSSVKTCTSNPTWGSWQAHAHSGNSTTTTISSLANATSYQVRVQATNSVGDSGWSASAQAMPKVQPPDAPSVPTTHQTKQGLVVSWSAPAANGSAITDYDVRYRAQNSDDSWPSTWNFHAHTGTATTTIINNLTSSTAGSGATTTIRAQANGTAYQVQVRAANSVGDGGWSPQPPDAPAAPSLTAANEALVVSWSAPAANGSAITDYDVRYRVKDTDQNTIGNQPGNWQSQPHTGAAVTTAISGLTNGTVYQVQVRAANSVDVGGWSLSAQAIPAAQPPDAPAAPSLTAANEALVVSWSAPAANGSAITDYDVRYRVKDTDQNTIGNQPGNWQSQPHTGAAVTTAISGLTNGTVYQVQVRAANSVGVGGWSLLANATPASNSTFTPQPPDAPDTPTIAVWSQGLAVSWSAPATNGSAVTDYDVQYRVCTATPKTCTSNPVWGSWTGRSDETASDTATVVTITGLANGTAYQVRVRAGSAAGDSGWSSVAEAAPAPQKPDAPAAPSLTVDNASLGVSWSAPAGNGASISDYDVQYRACTLSTDLACSDSGTATWGSWVDRAGETASDTATSVSLTRFDEWYGLSGAGEGV